MADDCIFCKIAAGEILSTKVYENEKAYAFEDLNPMMPVHTLVVPKNHYKNVGEEVPADELAALFEAVRAVAALKGIDGSGFRIVSNAGPDAQQTVDHLHIHVLGGAPMNSGDPSLS